ncbi:MAG TPA: hypothetical protein VK135_05435 [Candidatus Dormibacteraeota bacterium]|nr:hypothetical protein [Candidatus Dormibacteraeota bacterium]
MLKVKIENRNDANNKNAKWHDLMTQAGVHESYAHVNEILTNDCDYVIADVVSDWARFDENTALDDMIETITILKQLIEDEVTLFKTLYAEAIHEPIDIAKSVRYNEMKYIEDVDEDDEIWETVCLVKETREIAILY